MQWFNDLKVSIKILLACLIFLVIIAAVSIQGIWSTNDASATIHEFHDDHYQPVQHLNEVMQMLLVIRVNMIYQQLHAEEGKWQEVHSGKEENVKLAEEYMALWKKFASAHLTDEEKAIAKTWEGHAENLRDIRKRFNDALEARDLKRSDAILGEWAAGFATLHGDVAKLLALQKADVDKLIAHEESEARRVLIMGIAFMGLAIVIGVIITVILSRAVSGPVAKGLAFARKVAQGDFTERIDLNQKDELGQLGTALNGAADNLERLIAELMVSSQNLAQAVEQISSGNQNLSQRTSEQASALEEVASTIEEATAAINQNAENANQAKSLTDQGAEKSLEGKKIALDAVSAIKEMNDSSKRIAEIIGVINDIAFQTNLLALNAAVEAARAGEQGRGFAVVAGEVRNLAQRSGNAAKEIEGLIREAIARVDRSTALVENTGTALSEISEASRSTAQIIAEIAAASQEQKQGIGQINTAVSEMDNMTQQNASLVEETASASEEMANQAQDLMEMVQQFKITDTMRGTTYDKKHREVHLSAAKDAKKLSGTGNGRKAPAMAPADGAQTGQGMKHILKQEGFEEF